MNLCMTKRFTQTRDIITGSVVRRSGRSWQGCQSTETHRCIRGCHWRARVRHSGVCTVDDAEGSVNQDGDARGRVCKLHIDRHEHAERVARRDDRRAVCRRHRHLRLLRHVALHHCVQVKACHVASSHSSISSFTCMHTGHIMHENACMPSLTK